MEIRPKRARILLHKVAEFSVQMLFVSPTLQMSLKFREFAENILVSFEQTTFKPM